MRLHSDDHVALQRAVSMAGLVISRICPDRSLPAEIIGMISRICGCEIGYMVFEHSNENSDSPQVAATIALANGTIAPIHVPTLPDSWNSRASFSVKVSRMNYTYSADLQYCSALFNLNTNIPPPIAADEAAFLELAVECLRRTLNLAADLHQRNLRDSPAWAIYCRADAPGAGAMLSSHQLAAMNLRCNRYAEKHRLRVLNWETPSGYFSDACAAETPLFARAGFRSLLEKRPAGILCPDAELIRCGYALRILQHLRISILVCTSR